MRHRKRRGRRQVVVISDKLKIAVWTKDRRFSKYDPPIFEHFKRR